MKIVEPYARMTALRYPRELFCPSDGITLLRNVEWFGRISHRSEEKQDGETWHRFIKAVVLEHGDWSITEHEKVTVDAVVDRGITHEWVRHRIGAYTQESTRFCNYGKLGGEIVVIRPDFGADHGAELAWQTGTESAEFNYLALLSRKVPPQIARSVLPNALASRIIVTYNLRSWRHFFIMRTCAEAHPQMRQVTVPLLEQFQRNIPLLYDDIVAGEKQSIAMKKAR